MRIRQITSITILLLLAATASNLVWALTPTSSMELPLTQREQGRKTLADCQCGGRSQALSDFR